MKACRMKPSDSMAIALVICTVLAALTALIITGHEEGATLIVGIIALIVFSA